MGTITTSNMDRDVDYTISYDTDVPVGTGGDTMSILADANRPIRPNMSTLILPGFSADYTTAQFATIHDIVGTNFDVNYKLPTGAHGAWGAVQNYEGAALEGTIQFTFDDWDSVISSHGITVVEYIVGAGMPSSVPLGANDADAGTVGRGTYDIRFVPTRGITQAQQLDGLEGYGWDEVNQQYAKLRVIVTDCFGKAVRGDNVTIDTTGDVLITNSVGIAIFEAPAQTLDITGLRGSKAKTAVLTALEQTDVTFAYTGFDVSVLDGYNLPVIGAPVTVEEVGGDEVFQVSVDTDGNAIFPILKLSTNYKITVLHYYRTATSGDEGIPMYLVFSEDTITDWTPPAGYPATIGYFIIYVTDALTGRAIDGLRLKVYDDNYTWQFDSHSGRGAIIVPAEDTDPGLPMTVEIIAEADRRYKGFKEEYTLEESEIKVYNVELERREVSGTH